MFVNVMLVLIFLVLVFLVNGLRNFNENVVQFLRVNNADNTSLVLLLRGIKAGIWREYEESLEKK